MFDLCWLIMSSHLLEAEIPELSLIFVIVNISHGVVVAPIVPHPHIITSLMKLEGNSKIGTIDNELNRAIFDTVLKQDNWRSFFIWNSVNSQNISIIGLYLMLFKRKSIFFDNLFYIVIPVIKLFSKRLDYRKFQIFLNCIRQLL